MQSSVSLPCIRVDNVSRIFGKKQVLFDISMNIPSARILGLLGPSGSGKTTLVKLMAGIDVPSKGEVYLMDEKLPKLSCLTKIGFMAQSDALYTELSAEDNLKFFASMFKMSKQRIKQRINDVIELVNLGEHLKKSVGNYSGGMKRRLSLAISLLHEPPVLILDEPTVGIDPLLRKSIWDELFKLRNSGTSIIVTTHVMDEVEKCDLLGMIQEGRLIAFDTPREIKRATGTASIEEAFLSFGGASQ